MFDTSIDIDIFVRDRHIQLARRAAAEIAAVLQEKPDAVIGTSTGRTQGPVWVALLEIYHAPYSPLSFKHARFVPLDENIGVSQQDKRSYWYETHDHFFNRVDARAENIFFPDGIARNQEDEAKRQTEILNKLGKRDIQTSGMGPDGHIAFCERGDPLNGTDLVRHRKPGYEHVDRVYVSHLADSTLNHNASFFGGNPDNVNKTAFTMDVPTILNCDRLLCMANGWNKIAPVAGVLDTEDSDMPVRAVRWHQNPELLIDWAACPYDREVVEKYTRNRAGAVAAEINNRWLEKRHGKGFSPGF